MPILRDNYPIVRWYPQILVLLESHLAETFPRELTHVVIRTAEIFPQATRGVSPIASLEEGVEVFVAKVESGWAKVAQNGKLLGYVQEDRLLKLKR